ncbi:hypothetical protein [Luteimonas huabeiensis]|uniref:hypothetical protein n=1 Tax=Luteimonas huabeiensis TaxID=1244513 RepID=UPI0004664815|nr:hypothetical protein [Luteimonas huabeiensis]
MRRDPARLRRAAWMLLAASASTPVLAQVRAPEPTPRQAEQAQWRAPPTVAPAVRPAVAQDPQVRQAQQRVEAQRNAVEAQRRHADRLRALPAAATPSTQDTLSVQREQQAAQRRMQALQRERDAAQQDARVREAQRQARPLPPAR